MVPNPSVDGHSNDIDVGGAVTRRFRKGWQVGEERRSGVKHENMRDW